MIIDWKEYEDRGHVLSWSLLEAMSKAGVEGFGEFDSSALNVELIVNGVSVPITEPMEFLQQQLEDIEKAGRRRGVEEAKYKIQDNIDALLGAVDLKWGVWRLASLLAHPNLGQKMASP